MAFTSGLEHVRIDSASVVANAQAQVTVGIFDFEVHALGSGMTKCVDQGLSADAVKLMLYGSLQRLLPAGDAHAKVHIGLDREFPLNPGQSQNQVQRAR